MCIRDSVDLGRNDIGKISQFKSVRVEEYLSILKYSHVMHIGSTVSGKILPDKDAIDAIDALLPAGTLSGAPKIKASSLIYELEGHKRYLYGGAIAVSYTHLDVYKRQIILIPKVKHQISLSICLLD